MIQPQNPYSPPQAVIEPEIHQQLTQSNRLLFIWIWLPVAILGAMLTAPADVFSTLCAMAFALPCYLLGVIWASELSSISRWLLSVVCLLVAAFLAFATLPLESYYSVTVITVAGVNVFLGVQSCRHVVYGRRRVFTAIAVAYAIGLLLGPLGVILLTVPAALISNRSNQQMPGDESSHR